MAIPTDQRTFVKNVKRTVINKAVSIDCKLCGKEISTYGMVSHLRHQHRKECSVDEYVEKFGEFRKPKIEPKTSDLDKIKCELCNQYFAIQGLAVHFRDSHNLTPNQYVNKTNQEYRPAKIKLSEKLNLVGTKFQCLVCQEPCKSETHLSFHVIKIHNLSKMDYVKNYVFKDGVPKCKCGCGNDVNLVGQFPYHRVLIEGHGLSGELNPMFGKFHGWETTRKMSDKAIAREHYAPNTKNTQPEIRFKEFLKQNSIDFEFQVPVEGVGEIDFYLPNQDLYVEIDGEYWHPKVCVGLNFQLLNSVIAQKRREALPNLIRIRENDLGKLETFADLERYNYKYDFEVGYDQIIMHKSYLEKKNFDAGALVGKLSTFVKLYQPNFPNIPTNETIADIRHKLSRFNFEKVKSGNIFKNNCSNLGVSYLKSLFKSYWKTAYKGMMSPVNAWKDEKTMRRVIKYRIGDNVGGETFNFSLHQLVRGLSAQRLTVSFFKPVLAAAIYKEFIGNMDNPVVFDPCCGFGGRLVGFKSVYPNGTYIGCEPNLETFLELTELAKNFEKVEIHNCKLEDFDIGNRHIDLTFTSIPYYDLETYSQPTKYLDINDWEGTFIKKLKTFPNLLVNIPVDLKYLFENYKKEYQIINNTSHFNKTDSTKIELLLKL